MSYMPSLSVRLSDDDLAFLKREAARQDRDVSYILREMIRSSQTPIIGPETQQVFRARMIADRLGLRTRQVVKMALDAGMDILDSRPRSSPDLLAESRESAIDGLRLNLKVEREDLEKPKTDPKEGK